MLNIFPFHPVSLCRESYTVIVGKASIRSGLSPGFICAPTSPSILLVVSDSSLALLGCQSNPSKKTVLGWHFYSILAKLATAQRPKLLIVTVSNPLAIAVVPRLPGTTKGCCSPELAAPWREPSTCWAFPAKAERPQQNLYRSTACFTPRTNLRFTATGLGFIF